MNSETKNYFLIPRKAYCFSTFDVLVGDETVGCIQQLDASCGVSAPKTQRDLWIIWLGAPHGGKPKGPGAHPMLPKARAINYILQAHRSGG